MWHQTSGVSGGGLEGSVWLDGSLRGLSAVIQPSLYSVPLFTEERWLQGTRKRGCPGARGPRPVTQGQLQPREAGEHRHDRGWRQEPQTWLVGQVWGRRRREPRRGTGSWHPCSGGRGGEC